MMTQYSTFFVPTRDDGEAQEQLNAFLRGHRVVQVERNCCADGWSFCVEWLESGPSARTGEPTYRGTPGRVDYMKVLSPPVFAKFARLREVRKTIASEEGVPPYVVMTDAMLAALAKVANPAPADLRKIDGVGEAKAKKYGERLLAALREMPAGGDVADASADVPLRDDPSGKGRTDGTPASKGGDAP